ncbi:MAG: succinate dehydrogenase, cytochrome b556 subunit [Pseudomonadales bacterium]|jgi:succinate dehydrogenase / fumarate reductase cytochrome b subunit|nr:succinate dehydrogenase, cytochrome b556 subunit [Pseudomonadales bacterium]
MSTHDRPVNVDLTKFAFPLPALVSITHRITGVILFVGIAFMLYALDLSLSSAAGFDDARALMATPIGKIVAWGLLTAIAYHLLAGVKHLFLDWDVGDTLQGARLGAQLVIAGSVVLSVLAGVWVW